jgi:hypothetical protein
MKQRSKNRFSIGGRVLVGLGMQPATVQSVADAPSTLGEYAHEVLVDGEQGMRRVLGCDLKPVPDGESPYTPRQTRGLQCSGLVCQTEPHS